MTDPLSIGVVLLQGGIFVILLAALRRGDVAAAVNALVSFSAVLVPLVVELVARVALARTVHFGPELPLWIAAAGLLHSFGMLGPYDSVWWWDHVTHTVSAALVAALVYAGLIVALQHTNSGDPTGATLVGLTVAFTFASGVFWEVIELAAREVGERHDIEPVLVHYGWRDTALDLVFDVVGALVVVLGDVRVFVAAAEQAPRATSTLVLGSATVVTAGSVVLALGVALSRDEQPTLR